LDDYTGGVIEDEPARARKPSQRAIGAGRRDEYFRVTGFQLERPGGSGMSEGYERDWRVEGECADRNPDIWFSTAGKNLREAKRLCGLCSVKKECLAFAVESSIPHGIWGGLSEIERRGLRRHRLLPVGAR
jgi:WhiB family transcriptional regulator, redox-sensing transcriptional regulator